MSSIDIFIYSYKGKIIDQVLQGINANNDTNINIVMYDQSPLFKGRLQDKLNYKHIFWDVPQSPSVYVSDFIRESKADYLLIMDDNIVLSKDWQEVLLYETNQRDVLVSGNNKIELVIDGLFYLKKNYSKSDSFELNNFIDRSFIFGKRELFTKFDYPTYLKYNGIEEVVSMELFSKDIEVYNAPTFLYSKIGVNTLEYLYTPFSINHNYNEAIELMHHGKNKFNDINKNNKTIGEFEKFHNINLKSLHKLPFQTNDVDYDPYALQFQNVDSRKFIDRTRVIS